MPKIKMLTTSAGPNGSIQAGQETTVSEKEAKDLVEGDYATYVEEEIFETENTTLNIDDYHVGGGYYELPNGDKVRGKEKAEEALKELEKAGDE
jgi:hypothetical protein